MESLYNIVQDKVEAAEFTVKEGSKLIGKPLWELPFKPNTLIASIVRDGNVILPRGNDSILAGDSVVVVTKDIALSDLSDVLQ